MPHLKVSMWITSDVQNIATLHLVFITLATFSSIRLNRQFHSPLCSQPCLTGGIQKRRVKYRNASFTCDVSFPLVAHLASWAPRIISTQTFFKFQKYIKAKFSIDGRKITYLVSSLFFPLPLEAHFRPPTRCPCQINCCTKWKRLPYIFVSGSISAAKGSHFNLIIYQMYNICFTMQFYGLHWLIY